jgi:hypothetical protein
MPVGTPEVLIGGRSAIIEAQGTGDLAALNFRMIVQDSGAVEPVDEGDLDAVVQDIVDALNGVAGLGTVYGTRLVTTTAYVTETP